MAQRFDCCRPVKAIHKGFCLSTLEKLMKYWPGGSYLAMKITPRVSGGRPLMAIGYKYNSVIVLGFIDAKGGGSTEPRDPYLSHFPDIYFNLSVCLIFRPQLLGRYLNACNTTGNHNMMRRYDLEVDKYRVKQSGYFRLATTVSLGVGITYGKLLFCHGISEERSDKKISTGEYKNRTIYE